MPYNLTPAAAAPPNYFGAEPPPPVRRRVTHHRCCPPTNPIGRGFSILGPPVGGVSAPYLPPIGAPLAIRHPPLPSQGFSPHPAPRFPLPAERFPSAKIPRPFKNRANARERSRNGKRIGRFTLRPVRRMFILSLRSFV
ncbi:Hypothetical protein NTJ_04089 [Nesidiocoris tenuis]|uniref:Uncharacterized protein n=1 Tax=Nesidiocoris tenuis TaxID=355587 RepID=A0ABN7AG78_9HEMI|nr:Hypothetical protein NTJ_04089 [Nesidiocoris tenuis]